jgi:putative transposase
MFPYRRKPTIRKPFHDYSQDGLYFVTSCIKHRICHFGNVIDNKMVLNSFGLIAHDQWDWLLNRYPYLSSHAFVVMPNHIHGVLEINRSLIYASRPEVGQTEKASIASISQLSEQPIKIKPLDQLLGAYKTTSSKLIHLSNLPEFEWQRSYHDHIIRAEKSYQRIVDYIRTNPESWEQDRFYR